jgi:hypothetical protein
VSDDRESSEAGLLEALGAQAREPEMEARLEERWDQWHAYAAGESDGEGLEAPALREVLRPFEAEDLDRFTDAAAEALGVADTSEPARETTAEVRRGPARWWVRGAVAMAAAAVLLVVLRPTSGPDALPPYAIALAGGERAVRGDEGPRTFPPRFAPASRVEIVLRPETPGPAPVVSAFLLQHGARQPWAATPDIAPGGAVRFAGTAASLFGPRRGVLAVEVELRGGAGATPQRHRVELVLQGDDG